MNEPPSPPAAAPVDILAGGAVGLLLGVLSGLSSAPVVSTIVTAVVALLAGLFGLSDKLGLSSGEGGLRRLAAFALVAAVATPAAIWVRTHEMLGPSIADQIRDVEALGFRKDDEERRALLRFVRYGLLPQATTAGRSRAGADAVLYRTTGAGLCSDLSAINDRDGALAAMAQAGGETERASDRLKTLPADQQHATAAEIRAMLCAY